MLYQCCTQWQRPFRQPADPGCSGRRDHTGKPKFHRHRTRTTHNSKNRRGLGAKSGFWAPCVLTDFSQESVARSLRPILPGAALRGLANHGGENTVLGSKSIRSGIEFRAGRSPERAQVVIPLVPSCTPSLGVGVSVVRPSLVTLVTFRGVSGKACAPHSQNCIAISRGCFCADPQAVVTSSCWLTGDARSVVTLHFGEQVGEIYLRRNVHHGTNFKHQNPEVAVPSGDGSRHARDVNVYAVPFRS